jgi:hypothetical protein
VEFLSIISNSADFYYFDLLRSACFACFAINEVGLDRNCSYNFATLVGTSVAHSELHMPRDRTLRVRLNQREFDKIQLLAQQHDVPMSEVVRELIKQLPEPQTESIGAKGVAPSPMYTPVQVDVRHI